MGSILFIDSEPGRAYLSSLSALRCQLRTSPEINHAVTVLRREVVDIVVYAANPRSEWRAGVDLLGWAVRQLNQRPTLLCHTQMTDCTPEARVYAKERGFRMIDESSLREELAFAVAEWQHLRTRGLHFALYHGGHPGGTLCIPGETINGAAVIYDGEEYGLRLSPISALIFDCVGQWQKTPLTARTIERIITSALCSCIRSSGAEELSALPAPATRSGKGVHRTHPETISTDLWALWNPTGSL
jgi:hypothetical protein